MEVKRKTIHASEAEFYIVAANINHNCWLGHTEKGNEICNFRPTDKTSSTIREV
jgi:hypothetical protein